MIQTGAELSANKLIAIIKTSLDRKEYASEETWLSAMRVVANAASALLGLKMRADEGSMRARQFDQLGELLTRIAEEEKLRPLKPLEKAVLDAEVLS